MTAVWRDPLTQAPGWSDEGLALLLLTDGSVISGRLTLVDEQSFVDADGNQDEMPVHEFKTFDGSKIDFYSAAGWRQAPQKDKRK